MHLPPGGSIVTEHSPSVLATVLPAINQRKAQDPALCSVFLLSAKENILGKISPIHPIYRLYRWFAIKKHTGQNISCEFGSRPRTVPIWLELPFPAGPRAAQTIESPPNFLFPPKYTGAGQRRRPCAGCPRSWVSYSFSPSSHEPPPSLGVGCPPVPVACKARRSDVDAGRRRPLPGTHAAARSPFVLCQHQQEQGLRLCQQQEQGSDCAVLYPGKCISKI